MLFLNSWKMSSYIVRYDISPPAIQKQQWYSREAQIELPLTECECEWAFRIRAFNCLHQWLCMVCHIIKNNFLLPMPSLLHRSRFNLIMTQYWLLDRVVFYLISHWIYQWRNHDLIAYDWMAWSKHAGMVRELRKAQQLIRVDRWGFCSCVRGSIQTTLMYITVVLVEVMVYEGLSILSFTRAWQKIIYLYRRRVSEKILDAIILSNHEFWSYTVCLSATATHTDLQFFAVKCFVQIIRFRWVQQRN
jgi:hypothetical protein